MRARCLNDMKPLVLPLAVLIIIVAWATPFVIGSSVSASVSALLLLVSGAFMALLGIKDVREQFRHPNLLDRMRLALLAPHGKTAFFEATVLTGAQARFRVDASIRKRASSEASLADQIAALQYNLEQLDIELSEARNESRAAEEILSQRLADEVDRLSKATAGLSDDLEKATAGGLDLTVAGLWFVIAGTILSALPSLGFFLG